MKLFIIITLLSSFLFFLIVSFGMKYHWVDSIKADHKQITDLPIPDQTGIPTLKTENNALTLQQDFKPEIINDDGANTLLVGMMTKAQIKDYCLTLFTKLHRTSGQRDIFLGSCVVSNYQEPYKNIQNGPQLIRQQRELDSRIQRCRHRILNNYKHLQVIEKELMIGICASNSLP